MPDEPRARSGAPEGEAPEAARLRQTASEMILSAPDLTDELTDDEAQPLIHWAVRQAEAAAGDLARAIQDKEISPNRDPGDILADQIDPVRRMMRRINRLVARRRDLLGEELWEEVQSLFALAEDLPRPPLQAVPAVPPAELSARHADLENRALVQAVIDLLEVSPWSGIAARTQQPGQGE